MVSVLQTSRSATTTQGEERLLQRDISWGFYVAFGEELGERPIRLSYSQGMLEIMITKAPHEFFKKMLAKLVEMIILERNIPVRSGGSMTFQRRDLEKGFEPNECWWIASEAKVRGKQDFDFLSDPPPDLAIEVKMSHSLVDRIGISAAMKVSELWRSNGQKLRFCILGEDGTYHERTTSLAFPFLKPTDLEQHLQPDNRADETTRVRQFGDWLRQQP